MQQRLKKGVKKSVKQGTSYQQDYIYFKFQKGKEKSLIPIGYTTDI